MPPPGRRLPIEAEERLNHAGMVALHRDLSALRREDAAFQAPGALGGTLGLDGAVRGTEAFMLRFCGSVAGHGWGLPWSSKVMCYGGGGTPPIYRTEKGGGMEKNGRAGWHLPGHAAVVLKPMPMDRSESAVPAAPGTADD